MLGWAPTTFPIITRWLLIQTAYNTGNVVKLIKFCELMCAQLAPDHELRALLLRGTGTGSPGYDHSQVRFEKRVARAPMWPAEHQFQCTDATILGRL